MTAAEYKAVRCSLNLTQAALGALLGVSTTTVCRKEIGLVGIGTVDYWQLVGVASHLDKRVHRALLSVVRTRKRHSIAKLLELG